MIRIHLKARVRLTGDSVLRKTEQGWRIEGLSVKTGEVVAGRPSTNGSTQGISPPYVAFDGKFSYRPPDGWVLQDNPGSKYKVAVLSNREGFGPNMNVGADFYPGTLDAYLAYVLHTLEAGMTFRVLSQSDFTTAVNQRAIRAIGRLAGARVSD